MKKTIIGLCILCMLCCACSDNKVIDNVNYKTYGLLNQDKYKSPDIEYRIVWGNVVWGGFLCETIVAPIYFFGFDIFEPVKKKVNPEYIDGEIK